MMSGGALMSWTQDIQTQADAGSDLALRSAADILSNDAASSSNPENDHALLNDQEAVPGACSALGY
jgi:hypothetical protein